MKKNLKLLKDFRRNATYFEYKESSSNKDAKYLNSCIRFRLVHYCCKDH